MEAIDEEPLHVERVAALDVGKGALEVCVRVPSQTGTRRRAQEVRGFGTTKRERALRVLEVSRVARSARVVRP